MRDFDELCGLLGVVDDLRRAAELMEWDQETYMPSGAADSRARQVATLRRLAHERFTDERVGTLLDRLSSTELDAVGADLVAVVRRDFARACAISARLVQDLAVASGRAKEAWRVARSAGDFARFAPHLERIIDLTIEKAEAIGYTKCRYDALLDEYEPDMHTAQINALFAPLRAELVPIVQAIRQGDEPRSEFLCEAYDPKLQWEFGMQVLRKVGFDLTRGRQDVSAHPFCTSFSIHDVRITTRLRDCYLPTALFGTLHEAGHALYEQGIDPVLENTPLADGTSLGMHESQSRLWENQVGRSRPFWEHFYAELQRTFVAQLGGVCVDTFYRAINRVAPSCIRVEADEVTYNLHIMLRFELEQLMVEQRVAVEELPELWNAKMEEYLGVRPRTDSEGILQDIHWALGAIGYFPTYALGNLMSAQIFACMRDAMPNLDRCIASGNFANLLAWLRTNIHRLGRRRSAAAIMLKLTGGPLTATPWLAYIRQKYGALYHIRE